MPAFRPSVVLPWVFLSATAFYAACGNSEETANVVAPGGSGSGSGSGVGGALSSALSTGVFTGAGGSNQGSSGVAQGGAGQAFEVTPKTEQTITVTAGQMTPTVAFDATLNGNPVKAGWSVDRGEIGTIPASGSSAVFTPSGNVGGLANVTAGLTQGMKTSTQTRQVFVKLVASQNGPNGSPTELGQIAMNPAALTQGGGIGGVGGEGLGTLVMDAATLAALGSPADDGKAQGLHFLYPYDKTVWPRGLLAPLAMWDWAVGDADAIRIHLRSASGSYDWTGDFGAPAILKQTGGKFIRHPIPEDVWTQATSSAGGVFNGKPDTLTIELTIAKGGVAHGPISETWTIAPGRLSGIIYYNSYGTQLAKNSGGALGGDQQFGGAVLSIHVGDSGPKLVAGSNGGAAECRVCHSVAANGSRLVVQHGDGYDTSSEYDLTPQGSVEKALALGATFPAMYPDGTIALSPVGQLLPLPDDSSPIVGAGLAAVTTNLGAPAFSPDGKLVAFNPMAGPVASPTQTLVVMSYDPIGHALASPVVVADDTGKPAETRPGWPAFLPDGKSLVFHHQSAAGIDGNGEGAMRTRKGAKAQIAWTSTASAQDVTPLDALNGVGYLPKLATPIAIACTADGASVGGIDADHGDDVDLNYEPTVNPIASGGFAWVVFTSRRMYGSEADIPPYCSDPRGVDLVQNVTTKKLWVAAIDLDAKGGVDASHPAFYLPGQELLAGNSRGFWVLDPCKMDGAGCATGDECCNGFCEPSDGGLICSSTTNNGSCSGEGEKCATTADCCVSGDSCINGFCSLMNPN